MECSKVRWERWLLYTLGTAPNRVLQLSVRTEVVCRRNVADAPIEALYYAVVLRVVRRGELIFAAKQRALAIESTLIGRLLTGVGEAVSDLVAVVDQRLVDLHRSLGFQPPRQSQSRATSPAQILGRMQIDPFMSRDQCQRIGAVGGIHRTTAAAP